MGEVINDNISLKSKDNLTYIKGIFKGNSDIVYREFNIGRWTAVLMYIDGMADKVLLDEYLLEPLMLESNSVKCVEDIKNNILTITDLREVEELSKGINAVLSGDTLMFIDGLKVGYVIASRAWPNRGIGEPSGETVVRGSREGFTETIRFNTVLVRRRIRDTRFVIEPTVVGVRSKTDVAIMYIKDIVNEDVLKELQSRIDKINIDTVLDSGYVEQLIEDDTYTPFPQIQTTERPDVVAAAVYEGRVALLVDNSPVAIIVPATLPNLLQSPSDYYERWMNSSIVRVIRLLAIFLSLILPAMYVAMTSFHTSIIPTKLAYAIAATREGVPFPAFIEAIIMEMSMALLIEAIVRLPKPIGATIGIVGGLIIGQAAVSAGIVSPIMIIIVAITTITTFVIPNYEATVAFRIFRFILIIFASIIGLYGIMIGLIILLIHLVKLESFGIPYLAPIVNMNSKDMKDTYTRYPLNKIKERPKYMKTGDKIRQK